MNKYYNELLAKLKNRDSKKIGNNTYLIKLRVNQEPDGEVLGVAIKYHKTKVVSIYADGHIYINTGGWSTVTTQKRINNALAGLFPFSYGHRPYLTIKRKDGDTFLRTVNGVYEFNGSVSLDKTGNITNTYWNNREDRGF